MAGTNVLARQLGVGVAASLAPGRLRERSVADRGGAARRVPPRRGGGREDARRGGRPLPRVRSPHPAGWFDRVPPPGLLERLPPGDARSDARRRVACRLPRRLVSPQPWGHSPGATGGALTVNVEVTPEIDPQPGVNEVTVTEVALPRAAGCSSDAGCVQYRFAGRGLLMGARVVEPRGRSVSAYVHDALGHAVLGLCHIDARLIGGGENSLMSAGLGSQPGRWRVEPHRARHRGDPGRLRLRPQPGRRAGVIPRRPPGQPSGRSAPARPVVEPRSPA